MAADQGLADILQIISQGKHWLKANGWIALEHGYDQALAVQAIFAEHGFSDIRTVKDYAGNDRVTLAQWLAG